MSAVSSSPERIVGAYRIESSLGAGGQGEVYRSRHTESGELAAVKLYELRHEAKQQSDTRRRVAREVKALRAIQHPSVVRVLDDGEHHEVTVRAVGACWVAFEFVEGRNLAQMMKNAPAEIASVLTMCKALGEALDEVHRQRIIHRDIKPENIILREKKWSEPVLVDFGFAREVIASRLTRTGLGVGTSLYNAPEVRRDPRAVSPYSDQWSFARVVAELVLWSKGAECDLEPGSGLCDSVVEALEDWTATAGVFDQALDEDPQSRFESVTDMVASLEEALYEDSALVEETITGQYDGPHWDKRRPLRAYIEELGFSTVDKRPQGSLWVIASQEDFSAVESYLRERGVVFGYAENGGRASRQQPAYYTKYEK